MVEEGLRPILAQYLSLHAGSNYVFGLLSANEAIVCWRGEWHHFGKASWMIHLSFLSDLFRNFCSVMIIIR